MKAKINKNLCTGDGICVEICPEVFEMRGDTARVKIGIVPEKLAKKCREAARNCPSEAISIENLADKDFLKTNTGLWIDHRKAVVVFVTGAEEEIKLIKSDVERQFSRSKDSDSHSRYKLLKGSADDLRERGLKGHLNNYYDFIISLINDSNSTLIFGPGEAKTELKKRMEKEKLADNIAGIETADKMTERQIAAKVRKFFHK